MATEMEGSGLRTCYMGTLVFIFKSRQGMPSKTFICVNWHTATSFNTFLQLSGNIALLGCLMRMLSSVSSNQVFSFCCLDIRPFEAWVQNDPVGFPVKLVTLLHSKDTLDCRRGALPHFQARAQGGSASCKRLVILVPLSHVLDGHSN
jgi:hypothetical protein